MHLAPAVNYSVKRSHWQARLIVGVSLLAVSILAIFARDQMVLDARTGVLAVVILIVSTVAFLGWKRSPQGSLRWDGQHWYWSGIAGNPVCRLRMVMDFQSLLLVAVKTESQASIVLWLEAIPGDASWKSLRRAIVSGQAAVGGKTKTVVPGAQGDLA